MAATLGSTFGSGLGSGSQRSASLGVPGAATHASTPHDEASDAGPYAVIVRMGYRDLRFDVPILVNEDTVYEIIRRKMGAPPAAKEAVDALQRAKRADLGLYSDDEWLCVVCQGAYEEEEELMIMPCRHAFHSTCLLPWLSMHNTCPTCREAIQAEEEAEKKRLQNEIQSSSEILEGDRNETQSSSRRHGDSAQSANSEGSNSATTATSSPTSGPDDTDDDEGYVVMLSEQDVWEMRQHIPVRELRDLITAAGGESRDCIEKADLFFRYLQCLDRIRLARQEDRRRRRQQQRQRASI